MTLREKQSKFAYDVAYLLLHINNSGYECTLGDAARIDKSGHCKGSKHYQRLAIDINLFKNGKYLRSTKAHKTIGEFWKAIGHTWGGDFKHRDGNHYEY